MRYWIARPGGKPTGPFEIDRLRKAVQKGSLPPDVLACAEGTRAWLDLSEVLMASASAPPMPRARPSAGSPSATPWNLANPHTASVSQPSQQHTQRLYAPDEPSPFQVAVATKVFCRINIGAAVVRLLACVVLHRMHQSPRTYARAIEVIEFWSVGLSCGSLLVFYVPFIIIASIWIYRASMYARARGGLPTNHSPAWAVGCAFIPYIGGWLSATVLQNIWQASVVDPHLRATDMPSKALKSLWISSLVSQVAITASVAMSWMQEAKTSGLVNVAPPMSVITPVDVVAALAELAFARALLSLVQAVDRVQRELDARVKSGVRGVRPDLQ